MAEVQLGPWMVDLFKGPWGAWHVAKDWEALSQSEKGDIAEVATVWTAISYLALGEASKTVVEYGSISMIIALFRMWRGTDRRLLWQEDGTTALEWAEKSRRDKYRGLVAQIQTRAKALQKITEEQAKEMPGFQIVEERDAYQFFEPKYSLPVNFRGLRFHDSLAAAGVLDCAKSLDAHEPLFAVPITLDDYMKSPQETLFW